MLINVVACLLFIFKITAPLVQPILTDCVDKPPMEAAFCFMQEIWKDVVGYEGFYKVSSLGRVKRVNGITSHGHRRCEKIIKQAHSGAYPRTCLSRNGKVKSICTHRLVALAFIPNPENKPQVNHINANKTDNRVENLEWVTSSENCLHAVKMGLYIDQKGQKNPFAKLTTEDVLFIKQKLKEGVSTYRIHKKFFPTIGIVTIYKIKNQITWNHVFISPK